MFGICQSKQRHVPHLAFALACTLVMLVDELDGIHASTWRLYLVPVAIAGWLLWRKLAARLGVLALMLMILTALLAGHAFGSWAFFWAATANCAASLLAIGWLAAAAGRAAQLESLLQSMESD